MTTIKIKGAEYIGIDIEYKFNEIEKKLFIMALVNDGIAFASFNDSNIHLLWSTLWKKETKDYGIKIKKILDKYHAELERNDYIKF